MHSSEPAPAPPASGASLLLQLGRLIIRSRSSSPANRSHDRLLHAKLLAAKPSTSSQVQSQPKPEPEEPASGVEAQLSNHVQALWNEQIPICIDVLLAPDCAECYAALCRDDVYDKHARALLLERWTMRAQINRGDLSPSFGTSQWLLNAVRSQLHFSQLSAWLATLKETEDTPTERRRKLSRETCNFKKLEANCDSEPSKRKLNLVYSIKISDDNKSADFVKPPTDHKFPVTDFGNFYLNIILQSLPRLDDIPNIKCTCPKRKTSKDLPQNSHEDLVGKLNDLTIGNKYDGSQIDDRMLTPCSENGKHKCNCDDESDTNRPKKLDDKRIKEIAKYKRRLRKECKMKKLHDSTSSEGESLQKLPHTSIPILQASRFDRFRAIGCYRNQTYLTLPASRIETKSPFLDTDSLPPTEYKKTNTVGTQTEDIYCNCGTQINLKCDTCDRGMVRSEGNYNLASIENGARRKCEEDEKQIKKHKCDTICDNNSFNNSDIIKRPKLRRFFPIVDKIEKIVSDRFAQREKDIQELQLEKEDSVFCRPKEKRQKTYSIGDDDYVLYEKCDYGTFDRCAESTETDSPSDKSDKGFKFPDPKKGVDNQVPSPSEMDKFRWRFDSAASMVFHSKTGLPLTSSPAPLRRGNNCFDFDDSINGISGIKSALFHPISPVSPAPPSPASPPPAVAPPPQQTTTPKLRMGPSTGLLGSFEESALKGRLEPVATVHGFSAELGASGSFCPPHLRLPVTVFFYAPGGTNAPYMGHINLGSSGYRVARSGTIQVSLFNPHGTLVKMFVVLYDLTRMPASARTFLRQRTLYMPAGAEPPKLQHKWLRYLIHLRFMTSKSGKLYLHTDIRIIVSRKADLDTATAHSALFRPISQPNSPESEPNSPEHKPNSPDRKPNRVFGGCSDFDDFKKEFDNQTGVSYELRSFTYAPDNPKYSPR
ncbi:atos homolog atossa [Anticarsia gemmatalis]|uniref:atos homolog atossa n=1 Tax=Anticarsia gemmatalis TaxID=129554 RepID=UPI003F76D623